MPTMLRAFTKDFLSSFDPDQYWPKLATLRDVYGQKFKNEAMALLRRGDLGPEDLCKTIVHHIRFASATPDERLRVERMKQFIRSRGRADPVHLTDDQVLDLVCMGRIPKPRQFPWFDAYDRYAELFIELFGKCDDPGVFFEFCTCKGDVQTAIEWMYIEVGRRVFDIDLSPEDAMQRAAGFIGCPLDKYVKHAAAWWTKNPWTVLFAMAARRRIGVTLTLPVSPDTYHSVRDGVRPGYDCQADEVLPTSAWLLAEGLTLCPKEVCSHVRMHSLYLLYSGLSQWAYLTTLPKSITGDTAPLYAIAPGGTPPNIKRMESSGFKPTGACYFGTNVPLMERCFNIHSSPLWHPLDAAMFGEWRRLQVKLAVQWPHTSQAA